MSLTKSTPTFISPSRIFLFHCLMVFSIIAAAILLVTPDAQAAQAKVNLGSADSFGVLSGSAVTNTGSTVINGNLGVSPGTAITGFPPGLVTGETHAADAVALQAQRDLTTAYNDAAGRSPVTNVAPELGGRTLTPGVYSSDSELGLTGSVTLDAQGDPNAVFIFKAGSTLTTASGSSVNLINGAQACNVYWQIGSSATFGTSTSFVGDILALTSITVNNAATVRGRLLARNGSVTLDNNAITPAGCAAGDNGGSDEGSGDGGGGDGGGGDVNEDGTNNSSDNSLGSATLKPVSRMIRRKINLKRCIDQRFRVSVSGRRIDRVVFRQGGKVIATRKRAPFRVLLRDRAGSRKIVARVFFTDATPSRTLILRYRGCSETKRQVPRPRAPRNPGGLTG